MLDRERLELADQLRALELARARASQIRAAVLAKATQRILERDEHVAPGKRWIVDARPRTGGPLG